MNSIRSAPKFKLKEQPLIQSEDNSKFKTWLSLHTAHGIKKEKCFLLMGEKIIAEFLSLYFTISERLEGISSVTLSENLPENILPENLLRNKFNLLAEIKAPEMQSLFTDTQVQDQDSKPTTLDHLFSSFSLKKDLFNRLDILGTHFNLLLVSYLETFCPTVDLSLLSQPRGLEVIAPLGDPANLGALVRSSVGFAANSIWLTQESSHPLFAQVH